MEDQNKFELTQKLLESATSIIVVIPPDPSQDIISAGLALHLTLKNTGKKSQIGCGSEVHVDPKISGAQEISNTIGDQNLVISFDYHEDDLEKVDYDVRPDGKFYLMIKPKAGAPVPDVSNVKYSYSGANADLVITLGINSLEELGKIYADEKKFLDNVKLLSLNITPRPVSFTPNTIQQSFTSFSELISLLLEKCALNPTSEAAGNLLNSIYEETKNLTSPKMTADTFSSVSFLMRHGARLPNQHAFIPRLSQPAFFEAPEEEVPLPPDENPQADSSSLRGGNPTWQSPSTNQSIPQDWTKPKIFRASDV
ncbi:MAG: hypothetical protein UW48_C0001G0002 [Microgenomates group bacterium GW2011_GWC1_44_23]|nr:MAG: hypothetical protein UW48_C0001G0002 [Microgenomates group bacterium GW2011_GWC1_44_23]